MRYDYIHASLFCQLMIRPKFKPKEIAKRMNTTTQMIHRMLRVDNNPRLSTLRKLAKAYEVSIDELVKNYDDPDLDREVESN